MSDADRLETGCKGCFDKQAEIERLRMQANERALAWTEYTERLEREIEDQRNAVIEECARAIENDIPNSDDAYVKYYAKVVRALKGKP